MKTKLAALGLALTPASMFAAMPDPSGLVTDATTQAEAVAALVAAAVGFFVVVKIIKWIRK
jgi:hypothetical protein